KKRAMGEMVAFASSYNESQKQLLSSMELPYGVADMDGRFLWTNRAMAAILKDEKSARKNLTILFKEITPEALAEMEHSLEVHASYGESRYKISLKKVEIRPEDVKTGTEAKQLLAVYFYDETELYSYMKAITDQ